MRTIVALLLGVILWTGASGPYPTGGQPIPGEGKEGESVIHPDSLDTGEFRAMVIVDPADKQGIQGYFHLAQVFSVRMDERPNPRAVPNLVEAVNEYSGIQVDFAPLLGLDSRELHETPWIFLAPVETKEFTELELKNLGRYLEGGGFLLADAGLEIGGEQDVFIRHLIREALASLGRRVRFRRLRESHPIFHCFFDFDGPPPAILSSGVGVGKDNPGYLVGVEVEGHLAAVISYQDLAATWENLANTTDATRHLQFGINTIVFALTQEGGMTPKVVLPGR